MSISYFSYDFAIYLFISCGKQLSTPPRLFVRSSVTFVKIPLDMVIDK